MRRIWGQMIRIRWYTDQDHGDQKRDTWLWCVFTAFTGAHSVSYIVSYSCLKWHKIVYYKRIIFLIKNTKNPVNINVCDKYRVFAQNTFNYSSPFFCTRKVLIFKAFFISCHISCHITLLFFFFEKRRLKYCVDLFENSDCLSGNAWAYICWRTRTLDQPPSLFTYS